MEVGDAFFGWVSTKRARRVEISFAISGETPYISPRVVRTRIGRRQVGRVAERLDRVLVLAAGILRDAEADAQPRRFGVTLMEQDVGDGGIGGARTAAGCRPSRRCSSLGSMCAAR